jgi:hypothetical protein
MGNIITAGINQYYKPEQPQKSDPMFRISTTIPYNLIGMGRYIDDDQIMRTSYWMNYPDKDIDRFGLYASVEYNRTNNDGTEDKTQFKHLFPAKFDYTNPLAYKWNRDDVRKFVEGVPISILLGLGY